MSRPQLLIPIFACTILDTDAWGVSVHILGVVGINGVCYLEYACLTMDEWIKKVVILCNQRITFLGDKGRNNAQSISTGM